MNFKALMIAALIAIMFMTAYAILPLALTFICILISVALFHAAIIGGALVLFCVFYIIAR